MCNEANNVQRVNVYIDDVQRVNVYIDDVQRVKGRYFHYILLITYLLIVSS